MWRLSILLAAALALPSQALHFFLDGAQEKCFYEELPKGTIVVGHYHAEIWDDHSKGYVIRDDVTVLITVEEVFDNHHKVVNQRGKSNGGGFTFSSAESGEHRICVHPQNVPALGWGHTGIHGTVKMTLDLAIGESSKIEATDKDEVETLVQKIRDLNAKMQDIRREQIFQREREAEFRDKSETTNSRVVRWSLIQLAILGITCAWQLSTLRSFFIKQKLT